MLIHGKNINFALTVGASLEIAKLCPDGDIRRVGELLDGDDYVKTVEISIKMMKAMNDAYVGIEKLNGKSADVLTEEEILLLTPKELSGVNAELLNAFVADSASEIEAESKNANVGVEE